VVHQTPAVAGAVTNPTRGPCAALFVFCLYGDFRCRRRTGTFIPRLISFGKRTKTHAMIIILLFLLMWEECHTSTPTKLKRNPIFIYPHHQTYMWTRKNKIIIKLNMKILPTYTTGNKQQRQYKISCEVCTCSNIAYIMPSTI